MKRKEVEEFFKTQYGTDPEYLWDDSPDAAVFRRRDNRKWYGLIMTIRAGKLGLESDELVDVLNVKLGPILLGSFLMEDGFFRAYHMNKQNWASIILDGSVDEDKIISAIDISYSMTANKPRKTKKRE